MRMKPFLGLMLEPPLPFLSARWCNLMRKKNIVIVAHQLYNFHHNFRYCFIGHPTYCKIWEFPVLCKTEFSPSPCPWSPAVEVFPVHCHHPHHCHAHNDDDVDDIDVVYDGGNGDYVVDAYLIFVRNAGNAVSVNFLAECKKFQKNEKITALGSVYSAAVMYYFTLSV